LAPAQEAKAEVYKELGYRTAGMVGVNLLLVATPTKGRKRHIVQVIAPDGTTSDTLTPRCRWVGENGMVAQKLMIAHPRVKAQEVFGLLSGELMLMAKVLVFPFKMFNIIDGNFKESPSYATLETIQRIGGAVIEGSAIEIEEDMLDGNGMYKPEPNH
jgi:hypothetical protein